MRFLIILIWIVAATSAIPTHYQYRGPPAPIGQDGRVMDTPEVAHAKAAHLAAVAEAAAKIPHNSIASYTEDQNYRGYSKPTSVGHQIYHNEYGYRGPLAPLDHDGRVVDTPEVARAKAAHLAAYSHIVSSAPLAINENHSQSYKPAYGYDHGQTAASFHNNRVIDGPKMTHDRQAHLAAYTNALHSHKSYNGY